uniref:Cadherin_2 domain-containing protein n=1 Tax=Bursaphelenchus xylophilus TaxID=6326 RepID=A0A1I7S2C5_BURXY
MTHTNEEQFIVYNLGAAVFRKRGKLTQGNYIILLCLMLISLGGGIRRREEKSKIGKLAPLECTDSQLSRLPISLTAEDYVISGEGMKGLIQDQKLTLKILEEGSNLGKLLSINRTMNDRNVYLSARKHNTYTCIYLRYLQMQAGSNKSLFVLIYAPLGQHFQHQILLFYAVV